MRYEIQTVYQREDIEGFYDAFFSGKQVVRTSKKVLKIITTILAIPCWLFAALIFVTQLFTGNIQVILTGIPLSAIFVLFGFWLYSRGRTRFRSKASWKAYPNKGELLTYRFDEQSFTLTQQNSVIETRYAGLVRLCEDAERFYLFTSPQTAHILPKRNFEANSIDGFRTFLTNVAGMHFEQS